MTRAGNSSGPIAPHVTMPQGVTSNGHRVAHQVVAHFPQVTTMLGRRYEPGSDHHTGHAVDIMLPDHTHDRALGQAIADHMRAHASSLGMTHVIWDQHIWSVARSRQGWRPVADRGSDNANHRNHVHVSFG